MLRTNGKPHCGATPCSTDVLGGWGVPAGVEVTPEGHIWTGYGELMFFTGLPPVPVNARIITIQDSKRRALVRYARGTSRLERRRSRLALANPHRTSAPAVGGGVGGTGRVESQTTWVAAGRRAGFLATDRRRR